MKTVELVYKIQDGIEVAESDKELAKGHNPVLATVRQLQQGQSFFVPTPTGSRAEVENVRKAVNRAKKSLPFNVVSRKSIERGMIGVRLFRVETVKAKAKKA